MTIFNKKFLQWALVFVFAINISTMSAQDIDGGSLNTHQQSMAAIAALTATGNIEQLKIALDSGLNAGLTINEVKEALIQLYAYCGFPRSLNALNTLMSVLEERMAKGITDPVGKDASPVAENADKYQLGKKTHQMLNQG
jgi:4-carboxymuconolactone decarboxylase